MFLKLVFISGESKSEGFEWHDEKHQVAKFDGLFDGLIEVISRF